MITILARNMNKQAIDGYERAFGIELRLGARVRAAAFGF